jgi:uncharacterized protein (DUF302 family)
MSQSRIQIDHVHLRVDTPFEAFTAALEEGLGQFDPDVYKELEEGGDPAAVKARIESMAGPSGFMLFKTSNHGVLLSIVGTPGRAMQYLIGNPLFAIEMTRHALCAPLRVLVYDDGDGKISVEYDLPSPLFRQFGDERVDLVAASLDRKLEAWVATAAT